ncbi:MAG: gliding motility-associated C-terminal domain-containing protein, partial [Bacteroidota bacterium]
VTVVDANGLSNIFLTEITAWETIAFDLDILSDYNGFPVSCSSSTDGMAEVLNISGGDGSYAIAWSSGDQTAVVSGLTSGWWTVTVTDGGDCSLVDSVFLEAPESVSFTLNPQAPACLDGLGSISIENMSGGVAPITYNLNGMISQDMLVYTDLEPGNYFLEVVDANGCVVGLSTTLPEPTEAFLSLGPDIEVEEGGGITLLADTDLDLDQIVNIDWSIAGACSDCLSFQTSLTSTTNITLSISDAFGCIISDTLLVTVLPNEDIYIPNVISPNNDGINDRFVIGTGSEQVRLRSMQIFSRWGELVYSGVDIDPVAYELAWDGTHRGEPLTTGVFVYLIELEWPDGRREWRSGDLLLIP